MKFQFESHLEHQIEAIEYTVKIFENIDFNRALLSKNRLLVNEDGRSYVVTLEVGQEERLLENLTEVQKQNSIPIQNKLDGQYILNGSNRLDGSPHFQIVEGLEDIPNFTIEMETGTGKTYVYIRSILELNRQYDLSHFIIVVPSLAIKEGVKKTLSITKEHFKELGYKDIDVLEYDSSNLNVVKNFTEGSRTAVKVLVINIDAFNKENNKMNQQNEIFSNVLFEGEGGDTPINWIKNTNPVLVLDEPQNFTTENSKIALKSLGPKFILRYSATHKEIANLIYSLNPVKAIDKGLVKSILVDSLEVNNSNDPYIKVKKICDDFSVETLLYDTNNILKSYKIKIGDDLEQKTKNAIYAGYAVDDVHREIGLKVIGIKDPIKVGEDNSNYQKEIVRYQIKKIVEQHFKKQNRLKEKNIKVLSLFFIDKVLDYRNLDKENDMGELAHIFEEVFTEIQNKGRNKEIISYCARDVHEGYFSQDKKGNLKNSNAKKENENDRDIYKLIMKDKEKLLSLEEPVSFIFSHSALKEGWDNPNVFQICTLRDSNKEMTKRQQLGRGLRICVNQQGERVYGEGINELYVVANESYQDYASSLQKEYKEAGYDFEKEKKSLIKEFKEKQTLKPNKNLNNPEFKRLWELINQKTYYSLHFKSENLIKNCAEKISETLTQGKIRPISIVSKIHEYSFDKGIENHKEKERAKETLSTLNISSFITEIAQKTDLTRNTVIKILKESKQVEQVKSNPTEFIHRVSQIIREEMLKLLIDGIEYKKLTSLNLSKQETYFDLKNENWELTISREENDPLFLKVPQEDLKRTIWEQLLLDSHTEKTFVENNFFKKEWIPFFFKLPHWFKIRTPIGFYNPDFVYTRKDNKDFVFIREVKATSNEEKLRLDEKTKTYCAKKHFTSLSEKIDFQVGNTEVE